jgi:hypothetical protein
VPWAGGGFGTLKNQFHTSEQCCCCTGGCRSSFPQSPPGPPYGHTPTHHNTAPTCMDTANALLNCFAGSFACGMQLPQCSVASTIRLQCCLLCVVTRGGAMPCLRLLPSHHELPPLLTRPRHMKLGMFKKRGCREQTQSNNQTPQGSSHAAAASAATAAVVWPGAPTCPCTPHSRPTCWPHVHPVL